MPIYKRCSKCGKRIPSGSTCVCNKRSYKEYDMICRDQKSRGFYSSKEWEKARKDTLALDEGIDVYQYMTVGKIVAADTVHHIVPLRDEWERRCETSNLMSLHHDTHSMIERQYKKEKERTIAELVDMLRRYRTGKQTDTGGI